MAANIFNFQINANHFSKFKILDAAIFENTLPVHLFCLAIALLVEAPFLAVREHVRAEDRGSSTVVHKRDTGYHSFKLMSPANRSQPNMMCLHILPRQSRQPNIVVKCHGFSGWKVDNCIFRIESQRPIRHCHALPCWLVIVSLHCNVDCNVEFI